MPNKRRARFVAYFNGPLKGSRAKLMERTGLSAGRVTQLFDEREAFGERAARNMAESLGLPPDYFEAEPVPGSSPPGALRGLCDAFELIGAEMAGADDATREMLATLLQRLARAPQEATHLGGLAERLLSSADIPVTSATPAGATAVQGEPAWTGPERRTHTEPVKVERRRPPLGIVDGGERKRATPAKWSKKA
jgi:hypothetical protein